jgi:hypothetical protein
MSISVKHNAGSITEIKTAISREETLATIAAAIGPSDWAYVEERIASASLPVSLGSWEAAQVYSGAGMIGVVRLVPIAYGADDRAERLVEVHIAGEINPVVFSEEIVEEVAR